MSPTAGLVVDSSILIDHLRGASAATESLRRERRRGPVLVPSLVACELWKGAVTPRQRTGVQELLTALDADPFGPAMAQLAGEPHVQLRALGRMPPVFDPAGGREGGGAPLTPSREDDPHHDQLRCVVGLVDREDDRGFPLE